MSLGSVKPRDGRGSGDLGRRSLGLRLLAAVCSLPLPLFGPSLILLLTGLSCSQPPAWDRVLESIRRDHPSVRHIQTEELEELMAPGQGRRPLLVDARSREEYRVSHLPGAVSVPYDSDVESTLTGFARERPIVVYCSVGYRSSVLVEQLTALGFRDVVNLEGSIFKWANEGRPVVRGGVVAETVHPYDENWGTLLEPHLRAHLTDTDP